MAVSNEWWPRIFTQDESLLRLVRTQSYLVSIASDGTIACKACGTYVPWEPLELHFTRHMAELDRYLARKRKEKGDETAEGFYPEPCTSCGNRIPRTGKPGRPPSICTACQYPLAQAQSDAEILAEFL